MTYCGLALDLPLGGFGSKVNTNERGHEYFIPTKFGEYPSSDSVFTAAAFIVYPNKFTTFPTKLIKYLHNLIEIYMYIDYRLGQRQRQTPVGVLELRSCGTSQRIQNYFKVNLVNF